VGKNEVYFRQKYLTFISKYANILNSYRIAVTPLPKGENWIQHWIIIIMYTFVIVLLVILAICMLTVPTIMARENQLGWKVLFSLVATLLFVFAIRISYEAGTIDQYRSESEPRILFKGLGRIR